VRPPTVRYNLKVRFGKGFTLEELKEAGIAPKLARTLGISVDARRINKSAASLKRNVQRLKEYKSKLVLFPRNQKKVKAGEVSKEEQTKAQQITTALPIKKPTQSLEVVKLSDVDTSSRAVMVLRKARADARYTGRRERKAKEKAEKDAIAEAKK